MATGVLQTGILEMPWTSLDVGSADVVLATSQYQSGFLRCYGTLTDNRTVTFPLTVGRPYFVHNNTTGAFTLILKGATGTGVLLAQGQRGIIASDGTNFVSLVSYVDAATLTALGVVLQAAAVTDANALTTTETVVYADPDFDTTDPVETMLESLKVDVTEIQAQLNALLAALRTSGALET